MHAIVYNQGKSETIESIAFYKLPADNILLTIGTESKYPEIQEYSEFGGGKRDLRGFRFNVLPLLKKLLRLKLLLRMTMKNH